MASSKKDLNFQMLKTIIDKHPFFVLLSDQEKTELVQLFTARNISKQTILIKEGDIIDKIYIIAKGKAEVTRTIKTLEKTTQVPVAVLHPGQVIGLSDEGFFSEHGQRTATITALTEMLLFEINVKKFSKFMQSSPLYPGLKKESEKFLQATIQDRNIPSKKRKAKIFRQKSNNQVTIILKDEKNHQHCRLPEMGEYIWKNINGKNSIAQLIELCGKKNHSEARKLTYSVLSDLHHADFIILQMSQPPAKKPLWKGLLKKIPFLKNK